MGAMEDIQSSRRRRKSIPVGEQLPPLLVPSASDDKDETGSTCSGNDNEKSKTTKQSHSKKQPKNSSNSNNNRTNQRRKRKSQRQKEEPFWFLTLQVGTALLVLCLATFHLHQWLWPDSTLFSRVEEESSSTYDDDTRANGASEQEEKLNALLDAASEQERLDLQKQQPQQVANEQEKVVVTPATPPPLPVFELSKASKYDAFSIVQELIAPEQNNPDFWRVANGLKRRFVATYGGENAARMLLDRGMSTFVEDSPSGIPSDIIHTACRMHEAQQEKRPFRIVFGGYSVTAGRGNHFSQSFPFVMEDLLQPAFHQAGLDLTVRNAAIGGVPAFPYGWCMTNFWGDQPDVVSWDYSMNEAGGVPQGMEAYVRHVLTQFPATKRPPKLIIKDTHMATKRRDLLLQYIGLLKDPVVLHTDPAVQPFLSREEQHRPLGFQEWRKFGAPLGAPGQALHHPAIKEHELIGWMLAMHFLSALEVLVASSSSNPLDCSSSSDTDHATTLPHPISGDLTNTTIEYPSILFGTPGKDKVIAKQKTHQEQQWSMNPVHCRTSFQPLLKGNLTSIVVDGTTAENIDLLLPKSMMFYNKGWTMDLSEGEKAAKRKLGLYDKGLGFVDGKEAYYGLINSGNLRLLLPYEQRLPKEGQERDEAVHEKQHPKVGDVATDWFESVVICQVNEKRDAGSCNSAIDVGYRVGGFNVTNPTVMRDTGTLFLGKKLCTQMSVPRDAKLTSRLELFINEHKKKVDDEGSIFLPEEDSIVAKNEVGLLVEVFVTNHHIVHVNQACSVSHVVWEQQPSAPTKDKTAAAADEKRLQSLS